MNKELEVMIERRSWEYAKDCSGVCQKVQDWLDTHTGYEENSHEPCENCDKQCKGYSEYVDHANGAKWLAERIGDDLYSRYFSWIIRQRGGCW